MDVRCERCDTEYELDDDAIPPGGCPVQCTTCGHTFTVAKTGMPQAAAPPAELSPAPTTAEWLLETGDGKLHRFRNLTSLQKWIIERKVTREDKISRTGHAWRRSGKGSGSGRRRSPEKRSGTGATFHGSFFCAACATTGANPRSKRHARWTAGTQRRLGR